MYEGDVMEKDAFSGTGRRLPSAGEGEADYASRVPQAAPSNLTQELAQLLAASIAQNQANRGLPAGMPTSLELTNRSTRFAPLDAPGGKRVLGTGQNKNVTCRLQNRRHNCAGLRTR